MCKSHTLILGIILCVLATMDIYRGKFGMWGLAQVEGWHAFIISILTLIAGIAMVVSAFKKNLPAPQIAHGDEKNNDGVQIARENFPIPENEGSSRKNPESTSQNPELNQAQGCENDPKAKS